MDNIFLLNYSPYPICLPSVIVFEIQEMSLVASEEFPVVRIIRHAVRIPLSFKILCNKNNAFLGWSAKLKFDFYNFRISQKIAGTNNLL